MKKTRLISLILLICISLAFAAPAASADIPQPRLQSADAVLVVDMVTDTILYEKNKDDYHSIASLTKIMTCLLAVEAVEQGRVNLDDMVTAQSDCLQGLDVSSSNAGITPGEVMSYKDLLYCALVHSANDACNVLATYIEGSIGAFVTKMNERAEQLGCQMTHFVDTDGMLNRTEGHYSCPYDLYLITKEALTHPLFATVCSTSTYNVSTTNYREGFPIHNSNALLSGEGIYGSGYIYDGVIGVKTGFTKPAGYCLVSVCKRNAGYIMVIVLGCNGPLTYTFAGEYQNFQDSVALYDWAFANYTNKTIFLAGEPLKRLAVEKAKDKGTVALLATENLTLLVPNDVTEKEILVDIIPDEGALVAPLAKDTEIGTANVYVRNKLYSSVRLTADATVELDSKLARQESIKNFLSSSALKAVLGILVTIFVLLVALRFYLAYSRRRSVMRRMQQHEDRKLAEAAARRRANPAPRSAVRSAPRMQGGRPAADNRVKTTFNEYSSTGIKSKAAQNTPSVQQSFGGVKIERIERSEDKFSGETRMHDASAVVKRPRPEIQPAQKSTESPASKAKAPEADIKEVPVKREAPPASERERISASRIASGVQSAMKKMPGIASEKLTDINRKNEARKAAEKKAANQEKTPVIIERDAKASANRDSEPALPEDYDLDALLEALKKEL